MVKMTDLSPLAQPDVSIKPRVAVLVDADNFPYEQLRSLEAEAATLGEITIRRAFGDATKVPGWSQEFTYPLLHCPTTINKKNLADMHLTVTAMDLSQRGLARAFVIASNDRDFDPLAQHLIATGRAVQRVRRAATKPESASASRPLSLEQQICAEIRGCKEKAGLLIADLSTLMRQKHKTKITTTTEGNWRAYLRARPALFNCDKRGPGARVRLNQP